MDVSSTRREIADLNRQVLAHTFRADLGSARRCAEAALSKSGAIGDLAMELAELTELMTLCAETGDLPAMFHYLRQLARCGSTEAVRDCLEQVGGRASWLLEHGESAQAGRCFGALREAAREVGELYHEAAALRGSANARIELGQYRAAIEELEKAKRMAEQEDFMDLQAGICNDQGDIRRGMGQMAASIASHEQALALAIRVGRRSTEMTALGDIGLCHLQAGNWAESAAYSERALRIAKELGDRNNQITWLNNLGLARGQADPNQTILCLEEAWKVAQGLGSARGRLLILSSLGEAYLRQGSFLRAIEYLRQSIALADEVDHGPTKARLIGDLASVQRKLGNYEEAEKGYEEALRILEAEEIPLSLAVLYTNVAHMKCEQQQKAEGYRYFIKAVELFDRLRSQVWLDHDASFLRQYASMFNRVIPLAAELDHRSDALKLCESAKSMSLNRRMRRLGMAPKHLAAGEREEWLTIRSDLKQIEAGMLAEERVGDWDRLQSSRTKQTALMQRHDALIQRIAARDASLVSRWTVNSQDTPYAAAKDSPVLEFFVTDDRLVVFLAVGSGEVYSKVVDEVGKQSLFRALHLRPDVAPTAASGYGLKEVGLACASLLESAGLNHGLKRLTVVPHHVLHVLPLHLMRIGDDYLRDLCDELHFVPNLAVLQLCVTADPRKLERVFILNNPDGSLDYAETEARAIRKSGVFENVREIGRENATPDRVAAEAGAADCIHLICHGGYDRENPFDSHLVSGGSMRWSVADILGSLEAEQASLAFLSACETGIVRPDIVDDYVGLPHAFLSAGLTAVISSLWKVGDMSTSLLVDGFYSALRKQQAGEGGKKRVLSLAAALKDAEDRLRRIRRDEAFELANTPQADAASARWLRSLPATAKPFEDPRSWAPFIVIGSPELRIIA
jgi:CHAT domain-containing protein/tetratricopeptide (TPR) repeat protein